MSSAAASGESGTRRPSGSTYGRSTACRQITAQATLGRDRQVAAACRMRQWGHAEPGSAGLLARAVVGMDMHRPTWRTKLLMKASRPGRKLRSPPCTMRLYEKVGSSTSDTCARHSQEQLDCASPWRWRKLDVQQSVTSACLLALHLRRHHMEPHASWRFPLLGWPCSKPSCWESRHTQGAGQGSAPSGQPRQACGSPAGPARA